jgi:hypothetical protein
MINRLVLILFLLFTYATFAQNVKNVLSNIPQKDREALESLFHRMMFRDYLSYTLFGDKPISLSGDFILTPYENILNSHGLYKCGGIFWKNWEIWEKYKDIFPIQNYLFVIEPSINCPGIRNIIFINKKNFVKKVNQHIDIFREKLNHDLNGNALLAEIEKKQIFAPIIRNDEMLWGILLGYGVHNANLYNERNKLERFIIFETLPKIPERKPDPAKNFSSIEEEQKYLNSRLKLFGEHFYSPLILNTVHFVADWEHPETRALEKKYRELRGQISAIYAQGDFLEITLSKLISKHID